MVRAGTLDFEKGYANLAGVNSAKRAMPGRARTGLVDRWAAEWRDAGRETCDVKPWLWPQFSISLGVDLIVKVYAPCHPMSSDVALICHFLQWLSIPLAENIKPLSIYHTPSKFCYMPILIPYSQRSLTILTYLRLHQIISLIKWCPTPLMFCTTMTGGVLQGS